MDSNNCENVRTTPPTPNVGLPKGFTKSIVRMPSHQNSQEIIDLKTKQIS